MIAKKPGVNIEELAKMFSINSFAFEKALVSGERFREKLHFVEVFGSLIFRMEFQLFLLLFHLAIECTFQLWVLIDTSTIINHASLWFSCFS